MSTSSLNEEKSWAISIAKNTTFNLWAWAYLFIAGNCALAKGANNIGSCIKLYLFTQFLFIIPACSHDND
jgi:hypothetical protein